MSEEKRKIAAIITYPFIYPKGEKTIAEWLNSERIKLVCDPEFPNHYMSRPKVYIVEGEEFEPISMGQIAPSFELKDSELITRSRILNCVELEYAEMEYKRISALNAKYSKLAAEIPRLERQLKDLNEEILAKKKIACNLFC